ncbi:MAG: zf-HC2 domain-containing protein [Chloroflexi bacterium]|nr:zf-HC2 domain-containing protein [Chloroflexota bacterium]
MIGKLLSILPFGGREVSCRKFREMASEYLEGGLRPDQVWKFNYHAERCKGCNAFLSTLRATLGMLKSLPSRQAPDDLKQRIREQFSGQSGDPGQDTQSQ